MRRKAPVPFGKGPTKKDPNHGHLAGGLLRSAGGHGKRTQWALLTFPWVVIMLLPGLAGVGRVRRG